MGTPGAGVAGLFVASGQRQRLEGQLKLRLHELTNWTDMLHAATAIHDNPGWSTQSALPSPPSVVCLAPTIRCVESGIAADMGGWRCTVPGWIPDDYKGAEPRCSAQGDVKPSSGAQTSNEDYSIEIDDYETTMCKQWVRRTLLAMSASEHHTAIIARFFLDDADNLILDEAQLEAFGEELLRRRDAR